MTVKFFTYCSRCRKVVNMDKAVACPETGRWMCPTCKDAKVSA